MKTEYDVAEWDLGDWPERLAQAVKIKCSEPGKFELTVDEKLFESKAREIARESVGAFLDEERLECRIDNGNIVITLDENGTILRTDSFVFAHMIIGFYCSDHDASIKDILLDELSDDQERYEMRDRLTRTRITLADAISQIDEALAAVS